MARRLGLLFAAILLGAIALDPFSYWYHYSYDVLEFVWWKLGIAALDAALLLAAAALLWVRRVTRARWFVAIDIGIVLSLALPIGHGDMIRIALSEWEPFQWLAGAYLLTILLRTVLFGLMRWRDQVEISPLRSKRHA